MRAILEIITPATTQDLTILATVKAELGITDTASDTQLAVYIAQASAFVASITGRVFGAETVRETIYLEGEAVRAIVLRRRPITDVAEVLENGIALSGADFVVDNDKAILHRLSSGTLSYWGSGNSPISVEYTAGYTLLGALPMPIERATIDLIKGYYYGSGDRDPRIRSETTNDLDSVTYFDGASAEAAVREMLSPFTDIVVA